MLRSEDKCPQCPQALGLSLLVNLDLLIMLFSTSMSNLLLSVTTQPTSTWTFIEPQCRSHVVLSTCQQWQVTEVPRAAEEVMGGGTGHTYIYTTGLFLRNGLKAPFFLFSGSSLASLKPWTAGPLEPVSQHALPTPPPHPDRDTDPIHRWGL